MGSKEERLLDCGPIRLSTSPDELLSGVSLVLVKLPSEPVAQDSARPIQSDELYVEEGPSVPIDTPTRPRTTYAGILAGLATGVETDPSFSYLGTAPPPLRAFPGFPGQRAPQNQNTPLGTGRIQNTKLGNGTSWGFGATTNGVPGLQNAQSRQSAAPTNSFAQTIGGPQSATPLDLSEFPSLSGAPQPQYQNPGQAIWANANQRAVQHTPVQRPQQQHTINQQASAQTQQQNQQTQDPSQQNSEDLFPATSQFSSSLDDYRHGGQGGVGQLSSSGQPQTGNIEEFPPLGRNGNEEAEQDRRGSLMQSAAFGGFSNADAFSVPQNSVQSRHGLPNAPINQGDNGRPSAMVDRILSPSSLGFGAVSSTRSPAESIRQGPPTNSDFDKANQPPARTSQNLNNNNNISSLLSSFHDSQPTSQQQASQPQQQPLGLQQGYNGRLADSPPAASTQEQTPINQMSALERFGLPGLLATVRSDNPDVASLAIGQDLTQLGLNLNSPEPTWPTFSGPFAESGSRPMQPDFHLPECYTVDNVHRVREKIPGFSDETLFWIFYTQPRDIMQELAATELTNRNWRYHKELMMWLTKDVSYGEPIPISPEAEKGSYVFFNHQTWQRARSDFVLHYNSLDNHIPIGRSSAQGMS